MGRKYFNKNVVEKSGLNRLEVDKLWKNHLNGYNLQEKFGQLLCISNGMKEFLEIKIFMNYMHHFKC